MHVKDFVKTETTEHLFSVAGDDPYYIKLAERYFENLISENARSFDLKNVSVYTGVSDLSSEVERIPMFSDKTVILVTDKDTPPKKDDERLERLIKEVPEDCILVFSGVKFLPPKAQALLTEISADRLSSGELFNEISALFPFGIERRAVLKLSEYCNREMQKIVNESGKLNAYANGAKITEDDVEALVSSEAEQAIFAFYDCLDKKNIRGAYLVMERLRKRGGETHYLLSSLIGQYRRMLYSAISPLSDGALAKQLGVKEYAVKKAREAAKKTKPVVLKQQFDRLTKLEFRVRSGELSSETALDLAVETLLEW